MAIFADTKEARIALNKLKGKVSKVEKEAVKEAEKLIADRLEANTPVWDGKKYNGKRGDYMQKHAKDHVVYSAVKDGNGEVGYDDDVAWRMHFVEFGTSRQLPQGFVLKTQVEIEDEVIKLMEQIIREALT